MSVEYVIDEASGDIDFIENIRWRDTETGYTVVISQPSADPDLWNGYLDAAQQSYSKHGVESVVDAAEIRSGTDTALFWTIWDDRDAMIGGLRAKGPLLGANDSHAVVEWAGQPGQAAVRKMIDDRAPFGVVEMKTAWASDDRRRAHGVTNLLARTPNHAMAILGCQFAMATAAQHVLEFWKTAGGVVAPIPATPYPDQRYRTKMMWWDRRTMVKHSEPAQLSAVFSELNRISSLLVAS
ncbi:hypothetical protein ABIA30_000008 [Mycobacterium sp. MAA66]|uniref:hypothetical protein n=1 Tax=Mycobacterium sp. MAA66 TaxID=3156297 RepID=UPI0035120457